MTESQASDTVENFHGVYLLYCKNPKYIGRTYIGYTVDPNRRIKQHNKGKQAGGAWRTSNRGPWSMVMIVHGFPNNIAALRFEWAWQHPQRSRRLTHLRKKRSTEKTFEYNFYLLGEMLRVGPWKRMPLTVRWFDESLIKEFPIESKPPLHMPIIYGTVKAKKLKSQQKPDEIAKDLKKSKDFTIDIRKCFLCNGEILMEKDECLKCLDTKCSMTSHLICLSERFLSVGEYVPVDGQCPKCRQHFLWGDFIRKLRGCYRGDNDGEEFDEDGGVMVDYFDDSSDSSD